jgi:ABC-type Zn uptake system ZnuABC Zn-binding protein ZnuA
MNLKSMKSIIRLVAIIFCVVLVACGRNEKERIILTSNHPLKLILQEIAATRIKVECLVPPSVSPHTFQPKPSDITKIEKSALFFYTSDLLDHWISKSIENKISVFDLLPNSKKLKFEEGTIEDPHFWTDPTAVISIVDTLANIIANFDPQNRNYYLAKADLLKIKLTQLDRNIDSMLTPIKGKSVFLFHPSFRYFLLRYGLKYGGSVEEIPGAEPTPNYLSELIKRIRESGAKAIFSEPQLNPSSAKVLAETANVKVYEIDPLGSKHGIDSFDKLLLYNTEIFLKALQ